MAGWSGDLVHAARMLWKNPAFSAVAIFALALGIGANTTVFSVVETLINVPIPMDDPDAVVALYGVKPEIQVERGGVSVEDYLDWRDEARSFTSLAGTEPRSYNVAGTEEPIRVSGFRVTAGFFEMVGDPILRGRGFRPEEGEPGADAVVVLSHGFWQQHLAGRDDAVGEALLLDGIAHTVVGVTEESFFFPTPNTSLWTPLVLERGAAPRSERTLFVMARLRQGTSVAEASAEMEAIAGRLASEHPDANAGWSARAIRLRDDMLEGSALATTLLYGSITFVLLIACANVANLLLARATVREREVALRTAMGAGRLRIVGQLLTESLLLSAIGGALGLLLGLWGMQIIRNLLAPDPNIGFIAERMRLSPWMLGHTVAVSVLAGVLFGLVPALQTSKPNLAASLKEGGRGGFGARRRLLRSGLVVAEVALALALLGTSAAMMRAFLHVYTADPGFDPSGVLTLQLALPEADYPEDEAVRRFYGDLLERLASVPGVEGAAATTQLPLSAFQRTGTARAVVEGVPEPEAQDGLNVVDLVVSPGYLETLGIPLLRGRGLEPSDDENAGRVALASREMVRRYWPDTEPLGRRFRLGAGGDGADGWISVVGVVADVQTAAHSIRDTSAPLPHVYLPHAQTPRRQMAVALRTRAEPESLAEAARRAVWDVDPTQPADAVKSMETVIAEADTQNTFFMQIFTGLSTVALLLAGIGIYGVISYAVHQRSKEIGIRMAMGARPGSILYLVVRQGAVLTAAGLALGVTGAVFLVRFLGSQLGAIEAANASSVTTYAGVSLVLLVVAKLASVVPARRAIRVDPLVTLRHD